MPVLTDLDWKRPFPNAIIMVFHTDKGSPGPPGFFYIPVNRKARAQTYGADMPHQPPPPGLPRKVDGHKKNHVCT